MPNTSCPLRRCQRFVRLLKRYEFRRTAMLLYVFSLEGLINRALDNFLPQPIHDFIIDREEKFSTSEKWQLLPQLAAIPPQQIDLGSYPWSHFVELLKVRNDYVHPKHDRMAYYEATSQTNSKRLNPKNIPDKSGLKEKDLVYGQTKIPKDPYGFGLSQLKNCEENCGRHGERIG